MIERRKTIRKPVSIPMSISLFVTEGGESKSIQLEGDIRDIAINGVCLEVKIHSNKIWDTLKNYKPDKIFRMHLEVPSHGHLLVADGTVSWYRVNELENKSLQVGMFLNHMDKETCEEWYRFVKEL